jgi:hypothetical protein
MKHEDNHAPKPKKISLLALPLMAQPIAQQDVVDLTHEDQPQSFMDITSLRDKNLT